MHSSCSKKQELPVAKEEPAQVSSPSGHLLGGATSVKETSRKAFTLSARNLSSEYKSAFFVGNSLFNKNWVQAPASTGARDGLGPLFISRSCSGCHTQDGRGHPPLLDEEYTSLLFKLSVKDAKGHFSPHPVYGDQIQTRSLSTHLKEPKIMVEYQKVEGVYADGSPYELERPIYTLEGNHEGVRMSPRVAPAIIGLGLLEAIPESTLIGWSDPQDRDGDGISGRLNYVTDVLANKKSVGRFGWKAVQPSVKQQVAVAFNADIGITTSLFPKENHTSSQGETLDKFPSGGQPELNDEMLAAVTLYSQTIAVPAQRNHLKKEVLQGEKLFTQMNCNSCHVSKVNTESHTIPALANQKIRPFTDLLLHDMGEGLSDGRPDNEATGREWRTAPLWGIGLVKTVNKHTRFLHDGRARSIEEAVLWHGGEAEKSKQSYLRLPKEQRQQVLEFLQSL